MYYTRLRINDSKGTYLGAISEVESAIFIELKGTKRIIHHKTHKMLSRSLIDSLPESQPIDEFNLQEYINLVSDEIDSSETFEL